MFSFADWHISIISSYVFLFVHFHLLIIETFRIFMLNLFASLHLYISTLPIFKMLCDPTVRPQTCFLLFARNHVGGGKWELDSPEIIWKTWSHLGMAWDQRNSSWTIWAAWHLGSSGLSWGIRNYLGWSGIISEIIWDHLASPGIIWKDSKGSLGSLWEILWEVCERSFGDSGSSGSTKCSS